MSSEEQSRKLTDDTDYIYILERGLGYEKDLFKSLLTLSAGSITVTATLYVGLVSAGATPLPRSASLLLLIAWTSWLSSLIAVLVYQYSSAKAFGLLSHMYDDSEDALKTQERETKFNRYARLTKWLDRFALALFGLGSAIFICFAANMLGIFSDNSGTAGPSSTQFDPNLKRDSAAITRP